MKRKLETETTETVVEATTTTEPLAKRQKTKHRFAFERSYKTLSDKYFFCSCQEDTCPRLYGFDAETIKSCALLYQVAQSRDFTMSSWPENSGTVIPWLGAFDFAAKEQHYYLGTPFRRRVAQAQQCFDLEEEYTDEEYLAYAKKIFSGGSLEKRWPMTFELQTAEKFADSCMRDRKPFDKPSTYTTKTPSVGIEREYSVMVLVPPELRKSLLEHDSAPEPLAKLKEVTDILATITTNADNDWEIYDLREHMLNGTRPKPRKYRKYGV